MRFDRQLSRMSCQTFSTGFNSGHLGGSGSITRYSNSVISYRLMPKLNQELAALGIPIMSSRTSQAAWNDIHISKILWHQPTLPQERYRQNCLL